MGDDWIHTVAVKRIMPIDNYPTIPLCLDGENACPPDDCGGVLGYRDLRKILKNPDHADYEEMREWAGRKFAPDAFDIVDLNNRLEKYKKTGRLSRAVLPDIRES
jgi:hypothetical protein